jgi:hypothetical protein
VKRTVLLTLLLGSLLAGGCTPQASNIPVMVSSIEHPILLSEALDLHAPPGAGVISVRATGNRLEARLTSFATPFDLEAHVERELQRGGWQRVTYEAPRPDRARSAYVRGNERVTVTVTLQDPRGIFLLAVR